MHQNGHAKSVTVRDAEMGPHVSLQVFALTCTTPPHAERRCAQSDLIVYFVDSMLSNAAQRSKLFVPGTPC
jgi:hypothetical protein